MVLLFTVPIHGQSLRSVQPGHWAYNYVDALTLRHPELAATVRFANRPWTQGEFLSIAAAARDNGLGDDHFGAAWVAAIEREFAVVQPDTAKGLEYYNEIGAVVEASARTDHASFEPAFQKPTFDEDLGEPGAQVLARHDFAVQRSDAFLLGWRYVVDQNLRNDPDRHSAGQRGTDAAFDVLEAYARFHGGPLWLTVGRQPLSLGPGRGTSVFVSDSIPALDQVRLEIGSGTVRFTGLVAQLSRERPNRIIDESGNTVEGSIPSSEDPVPFDVTRWLYLHRLDWRLHQRIQLSISEAALVTGVDRGLQLRYANPLLPYFVSQLERDEGDGVNVNVVVNVDGVVAGPAHTRFYGDLYAQELFIDRKKRERIGNQLAWRAGAEWGDILGVAGTTAGLEYTRVGVFTYLHRGLNTNWTTFGVPIGSVLGPDADQATVWIQHWRTPDVRIAGEFMVRRGGQRSVDTLESVLDAGNPPFPSGVVQRDVRMGFEAWGRRAEWGLEGLARISRRHVEHIAHDPTRNRWFWEAEIGISYRWRLQ